MARILLVDDDRESLDLYQEFLVEQGHQVTAVSDGVHALAALDKALFDVLVTDMVMPYIDGDRLAHLVRHRYATDPIFIIGRMSQGVLALDKEGLVVYCNEAALALLGVAEEELLGRPIMPHVERERANYLADLFERLESDQQVVRTTLQLQGGQVAARGELVLIEDDGERRFHLFLTDVTAEHAFSNALTRSKRGYRAIVESTSDLLWTLDNEGRLTYVNPSAAHFTGFSAGEYYAGGPKLLFGTSNEKELGALLSEAFHKSRAGESYTTERQLPTKDGNRLWSLIRVSALRDDDGEFIGLRCMATNIHRRRLGEIRLREAVDEREALIREIHHRVKNSVQLIVSMLRLRFSGFPDSEVKEASLDMENRIRVIASVYAQLYEYQQLDRLDGAALLRDVAQLARAEEPRLVLELEGNTFLLPLDQAIPVGIIVRELVANVSRHVVPVTEYPQLTLPLTIKEESLVLNFEDNGPGFSQKELESPERFGFLIATTFVQQLEGSITCRREEGGSTVTVSVRYTPPPSRSSG